MSIPLRLVTEKKSTSGPVIPDCVFRTAKSGTLDTQKQGNGTLSITLTPSPVIGDLRLDTNYELRYYRFTPAQHPVSRNPKFTGNIDNRDWPAVPRQLLGTFRTSAPEGEVIATGTTVFSVPFGGAFYAFFVLVNQSNPGEEHWTEEVYVSDAG